MSPTHPRVAAAGAVFAYLGPHDKLPLFPNYEWTQIPMEQTCGPNALITNSILGPIPLVPSKYLFQPTAHYFLFRRPAKIKSLIDPPYFKFYALSIWHGSWCAAICSGGYIRRKIDARE